MIVLLFYSRQMFLCLSIFVSSRKCIKPQIQTKPITSVITTVQHLVLAINFLHCTTKASPVLCFDCPCGPGSCVSFSAAGRYFLALRADLTAVLIVLQLPPLTRHCPQQLCSLVSTMMSIYCTSHSLKCPDSVYRNWVHVNVHVCLCVWVGGEGEGGGVKLSLFTVLLTESKILPVELV